jgi:predicted nuclease of predicted toxin-antitoxin system
MNFLADEGIDKQIVDRLRQDGHSVVSIAEESPGITDDVILEMANQASAVLVTRDKDFGELVYRMSRVTQGVILV